MQFRERYDIVKLLGRGTYASVFLVRDRHLNKQWAAKIFDTSKLEEIHRKLIENEIEILLKLHSLQMPRVIDLYRENHQICIVMDYMMGDSLKQHVQQFGPIKEQRALLWMEEMCELLEQLHTMEPSVIYCDLKPENIILTKNRQLALVDFGSARRLGDQLSLTGSRGYTAPELYAVATLSLSADVYSIGAVGAFLVTGLHPERFHQLKGDFSKPFVQVIDRCLSPCQNRIKNCEQLKKEIRIGRGKCI